MNIGLTELYVNLKNWDFAINGKYEMDLKEGQKYMYAYNCQKEFEEKKKAEYEQKSQYCEAIAKRVGRVAYELDAILDVIKKDNKDVSIEESKEYVEKLMSLRNELYDISIRSEEKTDGEEEKKEE